MARKRQEVRSWIAAGAIVCAAARGGVFVVPGNCAAVARGQRGVSAGAAEAAVAIIHAYVDTWIRKHLVNRGLTICMLQRAIVHASASLTNCSSSLLVSTTVVEWCAVWMCICQGTNTPRVAVGAAARQRGGCQQHLQR